ncbi:MAG: MotA/TolQ/ExbB proton channel family protein [Pseudomonadota bacterium]
MSRLSQAAAFVVVLILASPIAWAQDDTNATPVTEGPQTIDELVRNVRNEHALERERLQEREQRFREQRNQQQQLLEQVRNERERAEQLADELRLRFEEGENLLADLETELDEKTGDLDEFFAVVGQISIDALTMVEGSLVSGQFPDRQQPLEELANNAGIPSIQQLRELWYALLDEMSQNGRIVRFNQNIIAENGEASSAEITRIGAFSAIAGDRYLRYLPETQRFLALAQQPEQVSRRDLANFTEGTEAFQPVSVDPSRGAILGMILQSPNINQRVAQGGLIGYVILILGAIGLVLALYRMAALLLMQRSFTKAAKSKTSAGENSMIGKLRRLAQQNDGDREALATRLDEFISSASNKLNWGLATLAIFAAVSPLLGLLGTVTGMIETFQIITLFGAGDPRLMSGGISQALVTTQLGLAVAIPLLLLHSFLHSRANRMVALLDEESANIYAQYQPNSELERF